MVATNSEANKPIKSITIPIAHGKSFTIFFTRDGIGILGSDAKPRSTKKHYMLLFDRLGISAHETQEGKTKKHKHLGRVNFIDNLQKVSRFIEDRIGSQEFLTQMRNPILTNRFFLPLPDTQNAKDCLKVQGRRAEVEPNSFKPQLLNANQLYESGKHLFLVFTKARTRYHLNGFLVFVNPEAMFFLGTDVILEVFALAGFNCKEFKKDMYIPCSPEFGGRIVSKRELEISAKTSLAALSPAIIKLSEALSKTINGLGSTPSATKELK